MWDKVLGSRANEECREVNKEKKTEIFFKHKWFEKVIHKE